MTFFSIFCACLLFFTSTARFSRTVRMPSHGRYSGLYSSYGDSYSYGRRHSGYRRNLGIDQAVDYYPESGQDFAWACTTGYGASCETCRESNEATGDEQCVSCNPGYELIDFSCVDKNTFCPAGYEPTFDVINGQCQQTVRNDTKVEGDASLNIYACALACSLTQDCYAFDYREGLGRHTGCYLNKRCDYQDFGDGFISCKKISTQVCKWIPVGYHECPPYLRTDGRDTPIEQVEGGYNKVLCTVWSVAFEFQINKQLEVCGLMACEEGMGHGELCYAQSFDDLLQLPIDVDNCDYGYDVFRYMCSSTEPDLSIPMISMQPRFEVVIPSIAAEG